MKTYDVSEYLENDQYCISLKFDMKDFLNNGNKAGIYFDATTMEYQFRTCIKNNIQYFQTTYYPDEFIFDTISYGGFYSGKNKECMEKIACILKDVNEMSDTIFDELVEKFVKGKPNNLSFILDKHFSNAILKNTLSNKNPNKKKAKL